MLNREICKRCYIELATAPTEPSSWIFEAMDVVVQPSSVEFEPTQDELDKRRIRKIRVASDEFEKRWQVANGVCPRRVGYAVYDCEDDEIPGWISERRSKRLSVSKNEIDCPYRLEQLVSREDGTRDAK